MTGVRKIKRRETQADIVAAMPRPPAMPEAVAEAHSQEMAAREAAIGVHPVSKGQMPKLDKTKHDGGLYDGDKRHAVVIGIDSSATAPALTALSLEDGTAFSWVLKPKTKGSARLVDIELFFIQKLNQIVLRSTEIKATVMEGYGYASQMAHTIGEAGGVVKLALAKTAGLKHPAGIPIYCSPNGLKKFTTGSGGNDIKKQQMLLAISRKWNANFMDDNMADSFALAKVAYSVVTGVTDHAYEKDVLTKLEYPPTWLPPLPPT